MRQPISYIGFSNPKSLRYFEGVFTHAPLGKDLPIQGRSGLLAACHESSHAALVKASARREIIVADGPARPRRIGALHSPRRIEDEVSRGPGATPVPGSAFFPVPPKEASGRVRIVPSFRAGLLSPPPRELFAIDPRDGVAPDLSLVLKIKPPLGLAVEHGGGEPLIAMISAQ